jgi:hypothetical protein
MTLLLRAGSELADRLGFPRGKRWPGSVLATQATSLGERLSKAQPIPTPASRFPLAAAVLKVGAVAETGSAS